jgi:RHS repeat-associated protein
MKGCSMKGWPFLCCVRILNLQSWVEQIVTMPATAAKMELGMTWSTVTAGEILWINEVEVIKLETKAPEYQYFLKDHLGNVRVTFTTATEEEQFTATFEDNTQSAEAATFRNYSRVSNDMFDHTDAAAVYTKSQMLNGTTNSQIGVAKSIAVGPGDVIKADVYVKYFGPASGSSNLGSFATALLSAFNLPAPGVGEVGTPSSTLQAFGSIIAADEHPTKNNAHPKGWLNILVFDKDHNLVDMAFQQVDAAYSQPGGTTTKAPHQLLSKQITVKEPGYVYIYLSNEGALAQEIYFDDFKITHTKSPIIQMEDYYPFGLTFNSYKRDNGLSNHFKYNGKEEQDELDLGWLEYGVRNYSPEIGRWAVIDPLSEFYYAWSPYSYALNCPSTLVDLEGLAVGDPKYTGTGSVVIIIADKPEEIEEGYWDTSSLDDTKWDYGVFSSLTEANDWLNATYGKDNKKIYDLVIRSHGFAGSGASRHALNVQGTDPQFIRADDLNKGEGSNVKALAGMGNHLSAAARVLFTACNASQDGNILAEALFNVLSGKSKPLRIFTNGSGTALQNSNSDHRIKVNKDLNGKANQWKPWTLTTNKGSGSMGNSVPFLGAFGTIYFVSPSATPTTHKQKHKFAPGKGEY